MSGKSKRRTIPELLRYLVVELGKFHEGETYDAAGVKQAVRDGQAALKRSSAQTKKRVKAAVASGKAGRPSVIPEEVRQLIVAAEGSVREIVAAFRVSHPESCGRLSENTVRYIRKTGGGSKKDAEKRSG